MKLRKRGIVVCLSICVSIAASLQSPASASTPQAALFRARCSGCHTFGKGNGVGPDLKGVTTRHSRSWLAAWIRSSTALIRRGDPAAKALFVAFKQQRMPDQDLSDVQIRDLLNLFEAGGPDAEQHHLTPATEAKPDDLDRGRKLFFGVRQLASADVACVSCHTVSTQTSLGGSFAPDLAGVFTRYFDGELDERLKRWCVPDTSRPRVSRVDDSESLALRAFLRSISGPAGRTGDPLSAQVRELRGR